jgi:hypothetical protein
MKMPTTRTRTRTTTTTTTRTRTTTKQSLEPVELRSRLKTYFLEINKISSNRKKLCSKAFLIFNF